MPRYGGCGQLGPVGQGDKGFISSLKSPAEPHAVSELTRHVIWAPAETRVVSVAERRAEAQRHIVRAESFGDFSRAVRTVVQPSQWRMGDFTARLRRASGLLRAQFVLELLLADGES